MSSYTTQLRYILTNLTNLPLETNYRTVISSSQPIIFDFEYPIFSEEYGKTLEYKFLRHFYMYEIGLETYGLWKLMLENYFVEAIPKFNDLWIDSVNVLFNNYTKERLEQTYNRNFNELKRDLLNEIVNFISSGTNIETTINRDITSDTPMGSLGDPFSEEYATTAYKADDNRSNTSNIKNDNVINRNNEYNTGSQTNDKTKYLKTFAGLSGSKTIAEIISDVGSNFMSIDELFFKDASKLFMSVFDNFYT